VAEVGWVTATVADLRRDPNDRSERLSQLPMFTKVGVCEARAEWLLVEGPDGYAGWAKEAQVRLEEPPSPIWKVHAPWLRVRKRGASPILGILPLDTRFFGEEESDEIVVTWPAREPGGVPKNSVLPASWQGSLDELLSLAVDLVGVPYLWGGTTPFGFDCSGFVQRLFHFVFNRWLPRDSKDQALVGPKILDLLDLLPGDLLFFPGHVGLHLGKGKMVHASGTLGQVVITDLYGRDPYSQKLRSSFLFGVRVPEVLHHKLA